LCDLSDFEVFEVNTIVNGLRFLYIEPFAEIAWYENFTFLLDLIPVKGQFTAESGENLPRLVKDSRGQTKNKCQSSVTGDERWFPLESRHFTKWSMPRYNVLQEVKQQIAIQKFMLAVISGIDGFYVVERMMEYHN
jgi:hypothetical protein